MRANYHTHTWRCNHATGSEQDYVEQALAAGMEELGFSDHSPYPFADGHNSGFRMKLEQTAGYFETLQRLRQAYAGRIRLHIGFEAEYYPDCFDDLLAFLRPFGCEYLILGQHFLGNEEAGAYSGLPTQDESYMARYVDQVIAGMQTGCFTYFAHPDLVQWQGPLETYRRQMRRLCRAAKQLDVPLEINLLGLREGRHYPRTDFWQLAGEEGCRTVLGCDAHTPQALHQPQVEAKALALAAACGLHPEQQLPLKAPF